jgi:lysozyme family protein
MSQIPQSDDGIIDQVLQFEGGFTDDPHDHGGATNFGVTAAEFGMFLGLPGPATADQVRAMTRAQAVTIFQSQYIAGPKLDQIADLALRMVLVDSGVLFGTKRAIKWLQQVVGAPTDGGIGPVTLGKLAGSPDIGKVTRAVVAQRFLTIGTIVAGDATQLRFLRGWMNRTASLLEML